MRCRLSAAVPQEIGEMSLTTLSLLVLSFSAFASATQLSDAAILEIASNSLANYRYQASLGALTSLTRVAKIKRVLCGFVLKPIVSSAPFLIPTETMTASSLS